MIEGKLGRVRDPNNKNAPRTIDLDISLWNDEVFDYGEKPWHIPDPDIVRFAHVVVPLAELAPDYVHPVEKVTLAQIAARFDLNQLRILAAGVLARQLTVGEPPFWIRGEVVQWGGCFGGEVVTHSPQSVTRGY